MASKREPYSSSHRSASLQAELVRTASLSKSKESRVPQSKKPTVKPESLRHLIVASEMAFETNAYLLHDWKETTCSNPTSKPPAGSDSTSKNNVGFRSPATPSDLVTRSELSLWANNLSPHPSPDAKEKSASLRLIEQISVRGMATLVSPPNLMTHRCAVSKAYGSQRNQARNNSRSSCARTGEAVPA